MDRGFSVCKLFPAAAAGGIATLRALSGPFPEVTFCPTGGLHATNFRDYLALENVVCVGGSWMVEKQTVQRQRWGEITALAEDAMSDNPLPLFSAMSKQFVARDRCCWGKI